MLVAVRESPVEAKNEPEWAGFWKARLRQSLGAGVSMRAEIDRVLDHCYVCSMLRIARAPTWSLNARCC